MSGFKADHRPASVEANFDGLVGPTHNYAGLAHGNLASKKNADKSSNPRAAALQGLAKMQALAAMGLAQGILPPQERPHIPTLKQLGFSGTEAQVLAKARKQAPHLLAAASSASSMWVANAATVSPSADTADGKLHFTPANLGSQLHRSIEATTTARILQATFPDETHFTHHAPLPATPALGDEGAANHTRLCTTHGLPGLELFVHGDGTNGPKRYPARQARAASEAVARLHGLNEKRTVFAQQNPAVIDQGVFHNDVIAVGNENVLLYHRQAFVGTPTLRKRIAERLEAVLIEIADREISVNEAVRSYLFNSQLVTMPDGGMRLIVAKECEESPRVWKCIQRLIADPKNPIRGVHVFDLRQSMHNGGGPACLRLRVALNAAERAAVNPQSWITPLRARELQRWIERHYRDRLTSADLADPQLLMESRTALDELTRLLGLGALYDFQR